MSGILLSILGCVVAMIHFGLYWTIGDNVSAFQRACLRPNDLYDYPIDVVYLSLGTTILICNVIGLGMCIKLFMFLWKEEKDSRLRNRENLGVSYESHTMINCCYFRI